jgi:hypothetical protein
MAPQRSTGPNGVLRREGTLSLFGFPGRDAALELQPRSRRWRTLRALAFIGGGLILAPAVGLIPPHAPWVTAVLAIGVFLGIRKWRERFTILSMRALCPKCGGSVGIRAGTPLRREISVPCEGCNHESRLVVTLPG